MTRSKITIPDPEGIAPLAPGPILHREPSPCCGAPSRLLGGGQHTTETSCTLPPDKPGGLPHWIVTRTVTDHYDTRCTKCRRTWRTEKQPDGSVNTYEIQVEGLVTRRLVA